MGQPIRSESLRWTRQRGHERSQQETNRCSLGTRGDLVSRDDAFERILLPS